ncbi:hypothetical protein ACJRO7_014762 [Eucalyptus globulus]|uniref:TIR domain-containing protein n=1 Tax=Eucalyptus globulus TaxID=34317 RepID=A0ABD3LBT8_EUCGL
MDIQNSHNRGGGSSETREKGNDVFLSCSEQDNRPGFADGLYNSLHQAGIHVIRDLEERTLGQDTGQRLIQVIRHSKIAIPILSKNYPSSKYCLQELVQIVECHKTMGQIIMPVFLNVTPSVVKNISRGYGEAITKHGQTDLDPNILREWEEALIHVVAIPGLEIDR